MIFIQRDQTGNPKDNTLIPIAFPASLRTLAYPCARRRSVAVDIDGDDKTVEDKRSFPFDPEARLNTEHNNRRTTGTNGYGQSFLGGISIANTNKGGTTDTIYPEGFVDLTLAGYSFRLLFDASCIQHPSDVVRPSAVTDLAEDGGVDFFGHIIAKQNLQLTTINSNTRLYANVLLESVKLFDGATAGMSYNTWVLRHQDSDNQSYAATATALDAKRTTPLDENEEVIDGLDTKNYFFSGLSFSAKPATGDSSTTVSEHSIKLANGTEQKIFSLCILQGTADGHWVINQEALLPSIKHGKLPNSLEVGILNAINITQKGLPVATIKLQETESGSYQLQFGTVNECVSEL